MDVGHWENWLGLLVFVLVIIIGILFDSIIVLLNCIFSYLMTLLLKIHVGLVISNDE